ncbi:hypothetical protein ETB97_006599 [Aspergillus alliaceus]|uniref:Uncharacterized protein n=1 Tax=Petromyces alliaceus TaxID=209559 RepID=A0A5N7BXU3_PETAA|nr:hypothetical protein BDV23DRAFT_140930 [Aspergillus alliaceus]KAF5864754.1 hypothetical protein ETB97_006599 [Aspergillus burnettii]
MGFFLGMLRGKFRKGKGIAKEVKDEPTPERPKPNTAVVHGGSGLLSQCGCDYMAVEARNLVYNAPNCSSIETKEFDLEYLTQIIDLLEKLSFCEICSDAADYRVFLHPLCNCILEQGRLFYRSLVQTYVDMDTQSVVPSGDGITTDEERANVLSRKAYLQMKRLYGSVCRLIETLKTKPVFDEDAWWLVSSGAYRLALRTSSLYDSRKIEK